MAGALAVLLHARAVAPLHELGAEAFEVEIHAFGQHGQVRLVHDLALLFVQHVVHVPELAFAGGGLGRFRRRLGQRVKLRQRQVAEDQANPTQLVRQLRQRAVGPRAIGALEVAILDQGQRRILRAAYVFIGADLVHTIHEILLCSRRGPSWHVAGIAAASFGEESMSL
ncbi:hypothetical protein AM586_08515 [Massilia sp. WG5]|nr:hypothetical protein AM586_08515 [Massilia sp. WG5]